MTGRPAFVVLAAALLLPVPASGARRAGPAALAGRVVREVVVEANNVFDPGLPAENKRVYRAANALHRTTREAVLRREILIAPGDRYDPALARETERNLRALPFIRRAEATATPNPDGTVDVLVRAWDAWSLEIVAGFKRAGGSSDMKGGLTEHNLLGSGNELSAVYTSAGGSPSRSLSWRDRQFLRVPHLDLALNADSSAVSRSYGASLERPFFATTARSAAAVKTAYAESPGTLWDGGVRAGEAMRRQADASASYGRAFVATAERTARGRFGLLAREVSWRPLPAGGTPPSATRRLYLQAEAQLETIDFVTERRLQKFTHDEDYNVGLSVTPTLSWAPPLGALASESQVMPAVVVRKGWDWENRLLMLRASYSTAFVDGGGANRIAGGDALFFQAGLPRQTLAFHAGYDHGWRLDRNALLKLGESTGLRGYGLEQFEGERRLLLNAEDRIFLADEVLKVADVGAVVFADCGAAWESGRQTRLGDLKSSVGVGLRVAPSRSAGNSPVRIDLARALSSNGSRSRWSLSILAGHAFGPE